MKQITLVLIGMAFSLNSKAAFLSVVTNNGATINHTTGANDIYIDKSLTLRRIIISNGGKLICPTGSTQNITLTITEIIVQAGGELRCGTSSSPVLGKIKFNFRQYSDGYNQRRIRVDGGTLNLHGSGKGSDWGILSSNNNSSLLNFSSDMDWTSGDHVVVGSSDMDVDGHEVKVLGAKSGDNWNLTQSLDHMHHGDQANTLRNGVSLPSGGSAVGNLKRNLVISGDNCSYDSSGDVTPSDCENRSNGVDLIIRKSSSGVIPHAYIDSVEFAYGGRKGMMQRYPVHWHMVGNADGQYIKNSVIHNSKNRCIVVHRTDNLLVKNNFCFSHKGHGIFLEEGNERDNTIEGNLVISSLAADVPLLESERACTGNNDDHCSKGRWATPSSIWISHPKNIVKDNVVSGSHGTGFWMSYPKTTLTGLGATIPLFTRTPFNYFRNNRASSSVIGFTWDGLEVGNEIVGNHYSPRDNDTCTQTNPDNCLLDNASREKPIFSRLVAYKNKEAGIYYRGDAALFNESVLADNKWSFFVAYSQELRNSLVIGFSDKMTTFDKNWLKDNDPEKTGGIVAYDGPFFINTVDFNDFQDETQSSTDITPYPFITIGGTRKYINMTKGLKFGKKGSKRVIFDFADVAWRDSAVSTMIKDLDGSLIDYNGANATYAGRYILADDDANNNSSCFVSPGKFLNVRICPAANEYINYRFAVLNSSNAMANNSYVWFDYRDVDSGTTEFQPLYGGGGKGINKATVLSGPTYATLYRRHLIFPRDETADPSIFNNPNQNFLARDKFRIYASSIGVVSKPAKLRINGKTTCSVIGSSQPIVHALDWQQFHDTVGNAYFNHSLGLYVKMTGTTWHPWHKELATVNVREDYVDFDCD